MSRQNTTTVAGLQLFVGAVMHRRPGAQTQRFRHRMFALLTPLEQRSELNRWWPLLGHNRAALLTLHDRDHGPRDGSALRPWIDTVLQAQGIALDGGEVCLLAMPRILGYAFNPLSVWYCRHADGRLRAVLMEVRNTFGEWHAYLLHAQGTPLAEPFHARADKCFHVSPFQPLHGHYEFRVADPDLQTGDFSLGIRLIRDGATRLVAVQRGRLEPLQPARLLGAWLRTPLLTFKVTAMIHWHALKLFLRGARFFRKPQPPSVEITS